MEAINEYILKGIQAQRIAGPFDDPPLTNFVTSPLGIVPKSEVGKYRVIHDLSFPEGQSVNTYIPRENSEVQYDTIDKVISLVQYFGRGAFMAKSDIKDAFRIVPIHPSDYHLLGFTWKSKYYYDRCLPMGASSSCKIFEELSQALVWIMLNKYHASGISHILDDFFFISSSVEKCREDLSRFLFCVTRLIYLSIWPKLLPLQHS